MIWWVNIITCLIGVFGTLFGIWLKNYLESKKGNNKVDRQIQRDVVIYEILNNLRTKFNFSHVLLLLFHNGSKYFNGDPIQKASIVFETTAPGIERVTPSMQDVPLTTMTHALKPLSKDGWFLVNDIEAVEDPHYKNLMRSYRETKHYSFKIEDPDGWVGILTCDYTTDNDHPALTDACAEYIRVQSGRLTNLLKLTNKNYGASLLNG